MSLPDPVREFWYAACHLGERTIRTDWGVVCTDSRYPIIYDANNASVLEPARGLTLEDVRAVLHPALRDVGAPNEHIEVWDTSMTSPLLRRLRDERERPGLDAVMVFEGPLPEAALSSGIAAREITRPDERFWAWYGQSRVEFGEEMTPPVLEQLLARDRSLFYPAGLRFFAGFADAEMAGYASLLSLDGVGYIDNVVTLPAFRRRGVASATVRSAAEASAEGGDRLLFLLTDDGSDAQRLYERLGFRTRSMIESFTQPLGAGQ